MTVFSSKVWVVQRKTSQSVVSFLQAERDWDREMGTERYQIGSTRINNDRELALPEQAEVAGQLCSSNPVRLFEQRLGGMKDDESHEVSFCVTI